MNTKSISISISLTLLLMNFTILAQPDTTFQTDLEVLDSNFILDDSDSYRTLSTLGIIKNNSKTNDYDDLVVEVTYFDKNNILIDSYTKQLYDNIFPAHDQASFKMTDQAISTSKKYHSHKVKILAADIKKPCGKKTGFRRFMSDWGGLIFILAFFSLMIYSSIKYQKEDKKTKLQFMQMAELQQQEMVKISELLEQRLNK